MGTNAGILEAQTGKPCKRLLHPDDQSANQPIEMFRSLLPKHFEYEFFDADNEYPAAEGCADIFPGPYYCFYPVPTANNVELAHQYVQEIIEEEGPFDAVMGFSQVGHVLLTRYFSNFFRGQHWLPLFSFDIKTKNHLNQRLSGLQYSSVVVCPTGLTPIKAQMLLVFFFAPRILGSARLCPSHINLHSMMEVPIRDPWPSADSRY